MAEKYCSECGTVPTDQSLTNCPGCNTLLKEQGASSGISGAEGADTTTDADTDTETT